MKHIKIHHSQTMKLGGKELIIEGPVAPEILARWTLHKTLDAFRRPEEQHKALVEIASLPEGRIIVARDGETIVGYVTFHYPNEWQRWSEANMEDLVELGAIEVANDYRSIGLGKRILQLSFAGRQLENVIVYTTEYYWHWDLRDSKLSIWEYRKVLERLMKSVNMVWYATDDPEICSHPVNCLLVRVGKDVPNSSEQQFDDVRFRDRHMY